MANWDMLYEYEGVQSSLVGGARRLRGRALLQAVPLNNASANAGVYVFTFTDNNSVSVSGKGFDDAHNPMIWDGERSVVCDGHTYNYNLLQGWAFTFAQDSRAGDKFEVAVGCVYDGVTPVRVLSMGHRLLDLESSPITLTIKNVSGETLNDCRILATNGLFGLSTVGSPLVNFWQHGVLEPAAASDPFDVVVGDVSSFEFMGNTYYFCSLKDGDDNPVEVYDATYFYGGGIDIPCDNETPLYFSPGSPVQSGAFILSQSVQDNDSFTVTVIDSGDAVIFLDSSGNHVAGSDGLELTESGQDAGVVTNNAEVVVQFKLLPTRPGVNTNQCGFNLRVVGTNEDGEEKSFALQGSFVVSGSGSNVSASGLVWRITTWRDVYGRPTYSPNPEWVTHYSHIMPDNIWVEDPYGVYVAHPTVPDMYIRDNGQHPMFIPDTDGEWVRDDRYYITSPLAFVKIEDDENEGNYPGLQDTFEANGVLFTGSSPE